MAFIKYAFEHKTNPLFIYIYDICVYTHYIYLSIYLYIYIYVYTCIYWICLMAQVVRNLPVMQEAQFQPLGREDPWRREWQPTPLFLPVKSHGWKSLVGYSPWGCKESNMT